MMKQGRRVMGLDVGDRRTGVAISDELQMIATAADMVLRQDGDIEEFRRLIETFEIRYIVVGLPRGLSGVEGQQAANSREYGKWIADAVNLPFEFWDERLTSTIAERSLIERGVRREKRKAQIDAIAAAVMLQGWLDSQAYRKAGDAWRSGQGDLD